MKDDNIFKIPMDVIEECLKECLDNPNNKENKKEKTSFVSNK